MSRFSDQFARTTDPFLDAFGEVWTAPDGTTEFTALFDDQANEVEGDDATLAQRREFQLSWKEGALSTLPKLRDTVTRGEDSSSWEVTRPPITEDGWTNCLIVQRTVKRIGGV